MVAPLLALCLILGGPPSDLLLPGPVQTLLPGTSFLFGARPAVASSRTGESMIAWVEHHAFTQVLKYSLLDRHGQVVVPPQVPAMPPGMLPETVQVAACSRGFMLVWDATGGPETGPSPGGRAVWYQTFDLQGTPTSPPAMQANTLVSLDEMQPDATGVPMDFFMLTWVRRGLAPGAPSEGIYVRRFLYDGQPIEPWEVRVDDPSGNRGHQAHPAVATWPDFHAVVVWRDGPLGTAPSQTLSPDGHGGAVLARFLQPTLAPSLVTPQEVSCPVYTNGDQFLPRVGTDRNRTCVVGWSGPLPGGSMEVFTRRFDRDGLPLDPVENPVTVTEPLDAHLSSLAVTANGEFAVAWTEGTAYSGCTNSTGHPVHVARFTSQGGEVSRFTVEPAGPQSNFAFPALAFDQFGTLVATYEACSLPPGSSPLLGVHARRYSRHMIIPSDPTPAPGSSVSFCLQSPSDPGAAYIMAASGGEGAIPLDSRVVGLLQDPILGGSLDPLYQDVFQGFVGTLDAAGSSTAPTLAIPQIPLCSCLVMRFAFVTLDPAWPSAVHTVSPTLELSIQ